MNVKRALTRKLGPLPAWAWALIAGAGLYFYRARGGRGQADSAQMQQADNLAPYAATAAPADTGAGGAGDVGAAAATGEAYPDNKLREAAMGLIDQLRNLQDQAATAGGDSLAGTDGQGETIAHGEGAQTTSGRAAKGKASSRARKLRHTGSVHAKKPRARSVYKKQPARRMVRRAPARPSSRPTARPAARPRIVARRRAPVRRSPGQRRGGRPR